MVEKARELCSLETKFRRFDGELALKDGAEIAGYASLSARPTRAATWCRPAPMPPRWRGSPGERPRGQDAVAARPGPADRGLGRGARGRQGASRARPAAAWRCRRRARRTCSCRRAPSTGCRSATARCAAEKAAGGQRLLHEIELWEVSLVTFPMLPRRGCRPRPRIRRRTWRGPWRRPFARPGKCWREAAGETTFVKERSDERP